MNDKFRPDETVQPLRSDEDFIRVILGKLESETPLNPVEQKYDERMKADCKQEYEHLSDDERTIYFLNAFFDGVARGTFDIEKLRSVVLREIRTKQEILTKYKEWAASLKG